VILVGDLNVVQYGMDIFNPSRTDNPPGYTPQERNSFQKLVRAGFVDTFRRMHPNKKKFTYWSYKPQHRERDYGWRIDYVMTSKSLYNQVDAAEIHNDVMGSDH